MPFWFIFDWARVTLAAVGIITMVVTAPIAMVRSDRKGCVGFATAATVGVIEVILAAGYVDVALWLSFGHSALRMGQILRTHNGILEYHNLKAALGPDIAPKIVSEQMYQFGWMMNRFNSDTYLPHLQHLVTFVKFPTIELNKFQQWGATVVLMICAGAPFSPVAEKKDEILSGLLESSPWQAVLGMCFYVFMSTAIVWYLLTKVLHPRRFEHVNGIAPERLYALPGKGSSKFGVDTEPLLNGNGNHQASNGNGNHQASNGNGTNGKH